MAEYYYPFDAGAGSSVQESQWSKMARWWAQNGISAGYENELEVYADSSGMQVKVKSGMGTIRGHYYESTAEQTLAIESADPSNPRIDIVALEVDWQNNTMGLVVIKGTAGATPAAPALTQSTAKWQIPLAYIAVGTGVSTIASGNVTDKRVRVGVKLWPANFIIGSGASVISTGYAGHLILPPQPLKIIGIYALGDQSGSISIHFWVDDIENGVPTVADKISATDPFSISSALYGSKESFSGWTQSIDGYEGIKKALGINVESVSTFEQITLMILAEIYEV